MEEGNWVYGTLKTDYSDINFGVKEMPPTTAPSTP